MEIALCIAQDNPKRALSFVDELEDSCAGLGKTLVLLCYYSAVSNIGNRWMLEE